MKEKVCFKCKTTKPLKDFYKHPQMKDGYVNKCKKCNLFDNKISNGTQKRICINCNKRFRTTLAEVKRGGGNCCSRKCWYVHFRENLVKTDEDSHNWKGDKVGKTALHQWVERKKGKPRICEHCNTTKAKQYDWANVSQKYKRDLNDFIRLCRSCHAKYDYKYRFPKWKKTVTEKYNWNVIK
jgi:hypothetical protein